MVIYYSLMVILALATGLSAQTDNDTNNNRAIADVLAIKEGSDLDLSCPIESPKEDLIITWTCNDEPANIRSSRIHITKSGNLRIRAAKLGDSCNYRCEAAEGFGTISVVIRVIIVDKRLVDQYTHNNGGNSSTKHLSNNDRDYDKDKDREVQKLNKLDAEGGSGSKGFKGQDSKGTNWYIDIFPKEITLKKNQTFSLECKVKHSPQVSAPQIIWLKELNGNKPSSLSEAHERNLILIDNVYYHTLNWPKSIQRKSSSTNSALLVRNSSLAHSGRYVCLAGYPPSIMSSNLSSSNDERSFNYQMAKSRVLVVNLSGTKGNFIENYGLKDSSSSSSSAAVAKDSRDFITYILASLFVLLMLITMFSLYVKLTTCREICYFSDSEKNTPKESVENIEENQLEISGLAEQPLQDSQIQCDHLYSEIVSENGSLGSGATTDNH